MENKIELEEHFNSEDMLEFVVPLKNGLRHGESKSYYRSGVLSIIQCYANGVVDGVRQQFHYNKFRYDLNTYKTGSNTGVEIVFKYHRKDF